MAGYQVMPRLTPDEYAELEGFKKLAKRERSAILADVIDFPKEIQTVAIANAMWRKAHPGWRERRTVDSRSVYFIHAARSGLVKIGVAGNPEQRLRQIQMMSPEPLRIIHTMPGGEPVERELHSRFSGLRSHGEWFRLDGPLKKEVEGHL